MPPFESRSQRYTRGETDVCAQPIDVAIIIRAAEGLTWSKPVWLSFIYVSRKTDYPDASRLMRILDGPRAIFEGIRAGINGSTVLRHIRNRRLFPGLYLHPTVNHAVEGEFRYGSDVSFSEGCNLIVPRGALLSVGKGCYVGRYVELGPGVEIDIGGQTSIQDRSIIVGDVSLGRYCVLSLNVLMTSGTHYFEKWPPIYIRDQDLMVANDPELSQKHSQKISVGEDCWFGMNSVVMPGVSIGRGCVIGANAVVTKNLTPYSVVAGIRRA